jgi:hypothetical protein
MKVDAELAEAWALSQREQKSVMVVTDQAPQCWRCKRRLAAYLSRPWELICQKCNATNGSEPLH